MMALAAAASKGFQLPSESTGNQSASAKWRGLPGPGGLITIKADLAKGQGAFRQVVKNLSVSLL